MTRHYVEKAPFLYPHHKLCAGSGLATRPEAKPPYPAETRQDSSEKIEQIRETYKQRFQQESVLRADRCCEKVGF